MTTLRPEILWQCDNPPPPAMTRDEIAARLRRDMPELCDRLMDLALPAIGLWPQRRADIAATASRFGGRPHAPPEWRWPIYDDEPMLFVGQINCAELRGLPGADILPSSGLLAFFGSEEAFTSHYPPDHRCVFHWPDADRLVAATPPVESTKIFPQCALALRPMLDLPHPFASAVIDYPVSHGSSPYYDLWWDNRYGGIPENCQGDVGHSKLLGWPAFVQNDLEGFDDGGRRLLLQVDKYCNGEKSHYWGSGGSLFYVLSEPELRARNYDNCELECQFT